MVYVDAEEIRWLPYVKSWAETMSSILGDEMKEFVVGLFEYAVDKGLTFIRKNCDYAIHQVMGCAIKRKVWLTYFYARLMSAKRQWYAPSLKVS